MITAQKHAIYIRAKDSTYSIECHLDGWNGHFIPMHWLFLSECMQEKLDDFISTPRFSFTKSIAERMAMYKSRLQQRGPFTFPICMRAQEVILFDKPHSSDFKGVHEVMIEINIPVLIPAPHAPQNPQAPPGTCLALLKISCLGV